MRLMIVDDHAGIRAFIRERAELFAAQVHECASGDEAIRLCGAILPDCATVDLRMPGIDGLETIRRLRRMQPGMRLILVSQVNEPALTELALAAGADRCIPKDNLTELFSELEHHAERNR